MLKRLLVIIVVMIIILVTFFCVINAEDVAPLTATAVLPPLTAAFNAYST